MAHTGGAVLTFDSIAKQYPPERYILLMPQQTRHLLTSVPMWSLDVATVKVDPDNERQAYEIGWQSGEYGLTKQSLDALATAADLTVMAKRIDDRTDAMFAEYEAYAIMNTPSGGIRGQGRTCEWDGLVERDKVMAQAERYVEMGIGKKWKGFTTARKQELIDKRFAEQWLRAREFGKRMIESKAANRAIRAILGISPKYTRDELANKEFAVVRFVFTPDMADKDVKLLVVSSALQARQMLFNPPRAEAAPAITQATALPPPPESDPELPQADEADADYTDIENEKEVASEEWQAALALLPNIQAELTKVTQPTKFRQLQTRLAKAIENQDAATLNNILDYLIGGDAT